MKWSMLRDVATSYEVLSGRRFCKSCTTAGILFPPHLVTHGVLVLHSHWTACPLSATARRPP